MGRSKKKEQGATEGKTGGTSPTSGLIQTLEGGVLTKRSSRIASRKDAGEGQHGHNVCICTCIGCYMYTCRVE